MTHAQQVFCIYALYGGSPTSVVINTLIRADFAELRVNPAELESEIAVYVSEDESTATLASGLAERAPNAKLKAEYSRIAHDASSLAAMTRGLEGTVRIYASAPDTANRSRVTTLENRYLAAAATDTRTAPIGAVTSAMEGLCLRFERAAGEASSVVYSALKSAGTSPLTAARIRAALRTPAYEGSTLLAASPSDHVTAVTIRVNGLRVCIKVTGGVEPIRWVACP